MSKSYIQRTTIATVIAVIFHAIGLIGILFFDREFFIAATPYNMLLMVALIFYSQRHINLPFIIFLIVCYTAGFAAEVVGVNTGYLFGDYTYGHSLGRLHHGVPLVIGMNWFVIIYCCGVCVHMLLERLSVKLTEMTGTPSPAVRLFSVMTDGALLALLFDWVLEPAAVKLGYWEWAGFDIPLYNYLCWFIISGLLMLLFNFLKFSKHNPFAVNLLMIMMMFFMLVRTLI